MIISSHTHTRAPAQKAKEQLKIMESTRVTSDHHGTHQSRMDRHHTPKKEQAQPTRFNDTKQNRQNSHRKDRRWQMDVQEWQKNPSVQTGWCETPKIKKKEVSLRRRLLASRSLSDGNKSAVDTPGEPSGDPPRDESFDSPDISLTGPLTYSTLKADLLDFSCRKRRLLFSQVVTSTLETGRTAAHMNPVPAEPDLDESIVAGLPVSPGANDFTLLDSDSFRSPMRTEEHLQKRSVLQTPSLTPTSASEDSGFSSLGLDKSHDYSVDHDGSFRELVLPLSSGGEERRLSRLERQRRLSTLREGGSQSEDVPGEQRVGRHEPDAQVSEDRVFLDGTPLGDTTLRMRDLSLTPALQFVHALSCGGSRALQQQTSLEELLRVSDGPTQSRLPLSGLIGRKMGLDKVDIITELKMRNLRHVLADIVSLLSAADLYRFGQVSDDWSDVIAEDKKASSRRRCHIRELKIALETVRTAHVSDADTRLMLSCRSALSSVQAQARTPQTHTPRTPTQNTERRISTKRMEFLQVAKTLFNDEYLKPCPRCQHPARCHSLRGEGLCSWADCRFQFCTSCLCEFHGSRDCVHLSGRRRSRKDVLPGSAQSKRNVRRL